MNINKTVNEFEARVVSLINEYNLPFCIKRMALEKIVIMIQKGELEEELKELEEVPETETSYEEAE